jgi:hypothetical protein
MAMLFLLNKTFNPGGLCATCLVVLELALRGATGGSTKRSRAPAATLHPLMI